MSQIRKKSFGRNNKIKHNFYLICLLASLLLPWVPEAFHARFPVSVKSSSLVSSAFGRRHVGLRPTRHPPKVPRRTREKTSGTQGTLLPAHARSISDMKSQLRLFVGSIPGPAATTTCMPRKIAFPYTL